MYGLWFLIFQVKSAVVMFDKKLNRSRCFGFVTFNTEKETLRAYCMGPHTIGGNEARDPSPFIFDLVALSALLVNFSDPWGCLRLVALPLHALCLVSFPSSTVVGFGCISG